VDGVAAAVDVRREERVADCAGVPAVEPAPRVAAAVDVRRAERMSECAGVPAPLAAAAVDVRRVERVTDCAGVPANELVPLAAAAVEVRRVERVTDCAGVPATELAPLAAAAVEVRRVERVAGCEGVPASVPGPLDGTERRSCPRVVDKSLTGRLDEEAGVLAAIASARRVDECRVGRTVDSRGVLKVGLGCAGGRDDDDDAADANRIDVRRPEGASVGVSITDRGSEEGTDELSNTCTVAAAVDRRRLDLVAGSAGVPSVDEGVVKGSRPLFKGTVSCDTAPDTAVGTSSPSSPSISAE
jgi:hypothetical protein